jgi:hypothetical protein
MRMEEQGRLSYWLLVIEEEKISLKFSVFSEEKRDGLLVIRYWGRSLSVGSNDSRLASSC